MGDQRGKKASRSRSRQRARRRRDEEQEKEKTKMLEEEEQIDRTVMVAGLNIRADERDIYEFFSGVGKVRDVQVIRDARTGRSKGVGFVEFSFREGAVRAFSMSGKPLKGQTVTVQPSKQERQTGGTHASRGGGAR